ncbi:lipopolysaccharide biosynthesis protein [Geodermatophilus sp. SYSU D01176]
MLEGRHIPWGRLMTLLCNGSLLVAGVITSAVISRVLGPDGRGTYVSWQAWAAAVGLVAAAGLPQVVVLDDWNSRRHRLGDLLTPLASTVAVGVVLTGLVGLFVPQLRGALAGMVLVVVATQVGAVATAEAQRVGRMTGEFNVVRLLPPVAALVAMGALVAADQGAAASWFVTIALAQAAVLGAALTWVTRPLRLRPSSGSSVRKTLSAAARLGPGNWVTLLQYRADLLAVALIFPPSVVGYYSVGVAAQTAVAAAGQAGGQLWFARGRQAAGALGASLRQEIMRTAGLAAVVALFVGVAGPWWVGQLYGSDFIPAIPLAIGMCVVAVVQSVDYLLAHAVLLSGRGPRVGIYRLPAVGVLFIGLLAVWAFDLDALVVVVLAGLAYTTSAAAMAATLYRFPGPADLTAGSAAG